MLEQNRKSNPKQDYRFPMNDSIIQTKFYSTLEG